MTLIEFVAKIVDDAVAAASRSYKDDEPKRRGAVAGLEACRDKDAAQLGELLRSSKRKALEAFGGQDDSLYWERQCFALEVEWVCNCVSAVLVNEGLRPIVPPTARGVLKAVEAAGVAHQGLAN